MTGETNGSGEKQSQDTCQRYCFNRELVNTLRDNLPRGDSVEKTVAFFHALGTRTRVLILLCLSQTEELCVCDLANTLDMKLSTVSHQLRHLRSLGVVTYRNERRMAFYRLADDRVSELIGEELARRTHGGSSRPFSSVTGEEGSRRPDVV